MTDLRTSYLGLELRSPLVASASPLSADPDGIRRLADAGAAAIVMPSLFEEQIVHESIEIDRMLETGTETFAEATSMFPALDDYNTGPDDYLRVIEAAKRLVSVPLIGSINGISPGGWIEYAKLIERAGADALELNMYLVAADMEETSETIERRYLDLVAAVRGSIDIPLAVKVGPFFTAFANMARKLTEAGADGLVLFNRFYQPDIDPEALEVKPRLVLSTSDEGRLVIRWLALLRNGLPGSLAATTGIHTVEDVVKALLAGADVTMMASTLIRNGVEHLGVLEEGLVGWLADHGYDSVEQMKGSMSQAAAPDPSAFERLNYMQTIVSYSSKLRFGGDL